MFQLSQIIVFQFIHIFDIMSLFAAEFEEPEIGISDKGFNPLPHNAAFRHTEDK